MKTLPMKLLRLVILLEMMLEVVMGMVYMEVDKVANEVADMVINTPWLPVKRLNAPALRPFVGRQSAHCLRDLNSWMGAVVTKRSHISVYLACLLEEAGISRMTIVVVTSNVRMVVEIYDLGSRPFCFSDDARVIHCLQ